MPHTGGATGLMGKPAGASMAGAVPEPSTAGAPAKLTMKLPARVPLKVAGVSSTGCLTCQPNTTGTRRSKVQGNQEETPLPPPWSPQQPLPMKLNFLPAGKGAIFQYHSKGDKEWIWSLEARD